MLLSPLHVQAVSKQVGWTFLSDKNLNFLIKPTGRNACPTRIFSFETACVERGWGEVLF